MSAKTLHFEDYADRQASGIRVIEQSQTNISEHAHDFYELVYMQSGFGLHESSKAATLLIEGDLFLVPPGILHRYVGPYRMNIFNCLFLKDAVRNFESEFSEIPFFANLFHSETSGFVPKLHLDIDEQKRFTRTFRRMIADAEERELGWEMRVKCQLMCMLIDFARAYEKHVPSNDQKSVYPNYVAAALGIINERYSDSKLTVSLIARQTGVTPDYLSRQFRNLTGVGVQEYLRRYRFAKATELLSKGSAVGDVAQAVGFSSLCHFSREFKKEMGVTPTAYARDNN